MAPGADRILQSPVMTAMLCLNDAGQHHKTTASDTSTSLVARMIFIIVMSGGEEEEREIERELHCDGTHLVTGPVWIHSIILTEP